MNEAPAKQEEAAQEKMQHVQFEKYMPEQYAKSDGFTQMNPETGWYWIGINLNKFSFRSAWAFIRSQEFAIAQYMDQREQQTMIRAQLANAAPKARGAIVAAAHKLGIKI